MTKAGGACPRRCGGQVFPTMDGNACLQCGWADWSRVTRKEQRGDVLPLEPKRPRGELALQIFMLLRQGRSSKQIIAETGCSASYPDVIKAKYHPEPYEPILTIQEELSWGRRELVHRLMAELMPVPMIAKRLGISSRQVYRLARA